MRYLTRPELAPSLISWSGSIFALAIRAKTWTNSCEKEYESID